MASLHQIIAVEKQIKADANRSMTEVYQQMGKDDLLSGITRTYSPRDDEGEQLPPETKPVQMKVEHALAGMQRDLVRLFDIIATKDMGNTEATGNIMVDGEPLVTQVPVTYLLFLEKQLVDLYTLVRKLPVLDPTDEWSMQEATGLWASKPVERVRTQKIRRNHQIAPATKEHPAQVEVFTEDEVVGYWTTVKYSGALPLAQVNEMAERVRTLQQAVKYAREQANELAVLPQDYGAPLLGYIFGSVYTSSGSTA